MISIQSTSAGIIFAVYVLPRSSRIAIVGRHQDALKLKLTAPPVGGAANKQCIQVLAKALSLPKSALTIVSGQTGRLKKICVHTKALQMDAVGLSTVKRKLSQLSEKSV